MRRIFDLAIEATLWSVGLWSVYQAILILIDLNK